MFSLYFKFVLISYFVVIACYVFIFHFGRQSAMFSCDLGGWDSPSQCTNAAVIFRCHISGFKCGGRLCTMRVLGAAFAVIFESFGIFWHFLAFGLDPHPFRILENILKWPEDVRGLSDDSDAISLDPELIQFPANQRGKLLWWCGHSLISVDGESTWCQTA